MSELENVSLENILYAIEQSGLYFSVDINMSPEVRENYLVSHYPHLSKAERQATYFCRLDFKRKCLVWTAMDLKIGLLQIFEQRPDLRDYVFKATVRND